MNADLQNKLLKRFPMLYRGAYKSMQETCMCWGFDIPDAWYDIVFMLSLAIEDELKSIYPWYKRIFWRQIIWLSDRWNSIVFKIHKSFEKTFLNNFIGSLYWYVNFFEVTQVKSKYAGLRYYASWETDRIYSLISIAERASECTCEECGSQGKIRGEGWLVTLCDDCANKLKK